MTGASMSDPSSKPGADSRPRLRFPRSARVISAADFDRVMREGRRIRDGLLTFRVVRNGLAETRLGLVVGKRVGGAVARNRAKRVLREAFRLLRPQLPAGWDLAIQPHSADIRLPTVVESLLRVAAKLERGPRAERNEQ